MSFLKPQQERMRAIRERYADLAPMPMLSDLKGPFCAACGRQLTHPQQYVIGGTKRRPLYYCRRKACCPRRKRVDAKKAAARRVTPVDYRQAQGPRKRELPARPTRRRHLGNLFGLL
jgi:hypothetical protein